MSASERSSADFRREIESPFLSQQVFAVEAEEEWEPRAAALAGESSFQGSGAFEERPSAVDVPEFSEEEANEPEAEGFHEQEYKRNSEEEDQRDDEFDDFLEAEGSAELAEDQEPPALAYAAAEPREPEITAFDGQSAATFVEGGKHDEGELYAPAPQMEPASTPDSQAAEPAFSGKLRKRLGPLLDAGTVAKAVAFNTAQHPRVSEIPLVDLGARLEIYVERSGVETAMGGTPADRNVITQMTHQFQRKCFREARFHTGKLDEPTLDALGFVRHRGSQLNAADRVNLAATVILRRALTSALAQPLDTDVTAETWFSFMLGAPFLGLTTRWGTGIHLELMRHLRTAQQYLWTLPQYRDLSPVELGDALLWDAADQAPHGTAWTQPTEPDAKLGDRHRGARPGKSGTSMHLPGLAIDLAFRANPWVGDPGFQKVSGRAATLVGGSVTSASGIRTRAAAAFGELSDAPGLGRKALHALTQGTRTTGEIYDVLAQWNTWLKQYLALGKSDAALQQAIAARQADGTPGVAQKNWKAQIRDDVSSLRKESFSADGTPRDPHKGFLSLHRDLVVTLRDQACLAWGAVDLGHGKAGSGDMMHFDCRVEGIGRAFAVATGKSSIPDKHPCLGPARPQSEVGPVEESEVKLLKAHAGLEGKLFRLDSKRGGSATAVFVPPAAMKAAPLSLLVWIHGLSRRAGKFICGNADDAFKHLADPTFPLMKDLEGSGRPFILVAPSMRWSGDSHELATPKQMNLFLKEAQAFLEEVRKWLKANGHDGWTEKAEVGRLILAGHSKAYVVLDGLACRVDDTESSKDALAQLTDVWSFDTMYGQNSCASAKWAIWAASKPKVRFRVLYVAPSPTAPEAERLGRKLKGFPFGGKLDFDKVDQTTGHCGIVKAHFAKLITAGTSVTPSQEAPLDTEDDRGAVAGTEQGEAYETEDTLETFEADRALEAEDESPGFTHDGQDQDESWFSEALEEPDFEAEVVVSTGEFGDALAWFAKAAGVPDSVFWLLKQSPTFRSIIKALDAKYFHLEHAPSDWGSRWLPNAEGVFTAGPNIGRRMIMITLSIEGSLFRPFSSPEGWLAADGLHIEAPTGRTGLDERGAWLERIAHESIHAWRHVLGKRRTGKTAAERIRSGIDDEIATRKWEGKIVGELRKMFPRFAAYQPTTGSFDPWAVERDFFPGKLRLTYLEHFVLSERLEVARKKLRDAFVPNKKARTVEEEIEAFDKFVDRIHLEKRPLASYLNANPAFIRPDRDALATFQVEYPKLRLIRRIIDARWRSVKDLDRRNLYRDAELEKMRQQHAKAFLDALASYTQIP